MKRTTLLFFLFAFYNSLAQFTNGNLVVYRIGSGSGSINTTGLGNPVFLDEYTTTGTLVQSIPLPTTDAGGNYSVVAGSSLPEGLINRTPDGRYIFFTGYNTTAGGTISGSNRVVGRIDFAESMNITTSLGITGNIVSAFSNDGTNIWATGNTDKAYYTTLGASTSTELADHTTGIRDIKIFNNQLYVSAGNGIATVGSGTPQSGTHTITMLPGVTGNYYQFIMFDLDAGVAGMDVLYASVQGGGIQKFSLVGGTWVNNGTVSTPQYNTGLTGSANGGTVTLYAVANSDFDSNGGGTIQNITDASGYNGAFTGTPTVIATAPLNTTFRGLAFTPTQFPLPVKFSAIAAVHRNNFIEIKWSTSGAEDAVDYIVERSANGRDFTPIGNISSKGNDHLYKDVEPLQGPNFYRIQSIEMNGKRSLSSIVKVVNGSIQGFSVFPSPAKGSMLTVQLGAAPKGKYVLTLVNNAGQVMKRDEIMHGGTNACFGLDIQGLRPGYYVLKLSGSTEMQQKILIQ